MQSPTTMDTSRFTGDYYKHWYFRKGARSWTARVNAEIAAMLEAVRAYVGLERIRTIIDFGAGTANWQHTCDQQWKAAAYRGVEVSEYACQQWGWERGSVINYDAGKEYDLVLCIGVLQYLSDAEVASALATLRRHCRGLAFIDILTSGDVEVTDPRWTDSKVHLRSREWYRQRLLVHFYHLGMQIYVPRSHELMLRELEYDKPQTTEVVDRNTSAEEQPEGAGE